MQTERENTGARELLLSAFDGVPLLGSRELRLDEEEVRALRREFPGADFARLEPSGSADWYQVSFSPQAT